MCTAAESCTLGLRQQPDLSWDNPDVGAAMHIDEYTGRMIAGEVTKRTTRAWPRISQHCCRHPRRRPLDRDSGRYPDV